MTEVCYTGIYEWKVKCFVITCALTTVIQLKVIIIEEPSPVVFTLYTLMISSWLCFHVYL